MTKRTDRQRDIVRYVYAMFAAGGVTVALLVAAFYIIQLKTVRAHDRVARFHLVSANLTASLANSSRTLEDLVRATSESTSAPRALGDVQGIVEAMRRDLAQLGELQREGGDPAFGGTLSRVAENIDRVERNMTADVPSAAKIAVIGTLGLSVRQLSRLHAQAATQTLADYDDDQVYLTRFVFALSVIILSGTLVVVFLLRMLRGTLVRQAKTEEALARSREHVQHMQKQEALGQLVGGVAHDFNNLLTAILGQATLLRYRDRSDPDTDAALGEIQQAAEQAASLTEQLLTFSRRRKTQPSVLDLSKLVQNLQPLLRRLIGENIRVTERYDEADCAVELDPVQAEQVIVNLAVNARDAMPSGGELTFETANVTISESSPVASVPPPGDYVRLRVRDTGTGIDAETRARMFDPFFTTKPMGRGTGLGLSIVHGIVESAGGRIKVGSTSGVGTCFDIFFPRSQASYEPETEPETAPSGMHSRFETLPAERHTVLIVEDDGQIRRFMASGLGQLGYHVLVAEGGQEGLAIIRDDHQTVDAIISDVIMADMNGSEFMRQALELCPDAVPFYMSGYTDDIVLQGGVTGADVPLIHKPFSLDDLALALRDGLDGRGSRPLGRDVGPALERAGT